MFGSTMLDNLLLDWPITICFRICILVFVASVLRDRRNEVCDAKACLYIIGVKYQECENVRCKGMLIYYWI